MPPTISAGTASLLAGLQQQSKLSLKNKQTQKHLLVLFKQAHFSWYILIGNGQKICAVVLVQVEDLCLV